MGKILTKQEIQEIIEKYQNNVPRPIIAKEYGVSNTTIGRKLMENGIIDFTIDEETSKEICDYYLQRLSITDTAKKYGFQSQHISAILRKHNITPLDHFDVHRKYALNRHYFDVIDTPNKAYILGMWAADGNVCATDNSIMLGLQEEDKDILLRINNELECDKPLQFFNINKTNSKHKNIFRIAVYSYELQEALISHGVVYHKSYFLRFPNNIDDTLLFHFIRGYFDGDGHISKDGRRVCITSTVYFCETLMNILKKYGIDSYVDYCNNDHDVVTRNLIICKVKDVALFGEYLYDNADIYMKRKLVRFLNNKYFHIPKLACLE